MVKKGLYRGFSTVSYEINKNFKILDITTVKTDLLNHIFTRRGDRVMMPDFGTSIPDLTFEPIDEFTMETLRSDLEDVFEYDPRVELIDLNIIPDEDNNTINATATLKYIELNLVDDLNIHIEFRESF